MTEKEKEKQKIDLGLLEEDDEFEEFPAEGKNFIYKIYFFFHHDKHFYRMGRIR